MQNIPGRLLTRGLFFETTPPDDRANVVYTLKDYDYLGYPSLYLKYLECEDPTEYEFAKTYLQSWGQWQAICNSSFFKEYIDRWRWELSLKIKSQALRRIVEEAKKGKSKFYANKFLIEEGWASTGLPKLGTGRPTRERIKQEAERLNQIEKDILEDHERLN